MVQLKIQKSQQKQKLSNILVNFRRKQNVRKYKNTGGARGRLLPAVKSGTIDLSELLTSAGNMKKSRVKKQKNNKNFCQKFEEMSGGLPLILTPTVTLAEEILTQILFQSGSDIKSLSTPKSKKKLQFQERTFNSMMD